MNVATKLFIVVTVALFSFSQPTRADMSVSSFKANIENSSKRDMTYFYIEAVGTGVTWTNTILTKLTGSSLFCPGNLTLKGELATEILYEYFSSALAKRGLRTDDSISMALVAALMQKYPCG